MDICITHDTSKLKLVAVISLLIFALAFSLPLRASTNQLDPLVNSATVQLAYYHHGHHYGHHYGWGHRHHPWRYNHRYHPRWGEHHRRVWYHRYY